MILMRKQDDSQHIQTITRIHYLKKEIQKFTVAPQSDKKILRVGWGGPMLPQVFTFLEALASMDTRI